MQAEENTQPAGCRAQKPLSSLLCRSVLALALLGLSSNALAGGSITAIESHYEQATPYQYDANGISYLWGVGQNQILDGFYFNGHQHTKISAADQVKLIRVDIPGVATGTPCGVFAEHDSNNIDQLVTAYPLGASGECDMASMLAGRIINRGTLDTFSNTGPSPKNIERVDFIYVNGMLTSYSDAGLDIGGHLVAEKSGNNPVQIAAITTLDGNGEPSEYGPLVKIGAAGCTAPDICYGITPVRHTYSFLQSASQPPQNYVARLGNSIENIGMAFVSSRDLGLAKSQRYFGFSLFGRDVDAAAHDLLNPATFPQTTADNYISEGDSADLYGGMSNTYWDEGTTAAGSVVTSHVYIDQNGDNLYDDSDVGLPGFDVALYEDTDNNQIFDPTTDQKLLVATTSSTGELAFSGIPDGYYFVELDESSGAIPAGMTIAEGSNPIGFEISNGTVGALSFAFVALNNDGAVSAVADEANVRQDTRTDIDVLANDSDPTGNGLTISAVTAPAHGTATITGDQIQYTPSPGFNGSDSFSYTVTDSDGDASTAAVAVTVLRFSDINHNGLDDYEECNCDDIRLLTGIHGSSVGGGNSLWLLILMLTLPAIRTLKLSRGESA